MQFDIPSQPVNRALAAYGEASGVQVFYESAFATGRKSQPVFGAFTREAALHRLLEGTHLVVRFIATDTISVSLPPKVDPVLLRAKQVAIAYYGLMQADILRALCRNTATKPGNYRLAMQYWIGASGKIAELRVIRPSGDRERDLAVARGMREITFPPPFAQMPQPVTFAIEPESGHDAVSCVAEQPDLARVN